MAWLEADRYVARNGRRRAILTAPRATKLVTTRKTDLGSGVAVNVIRDDSDGKNRPDGSLAGDHCTVPVITIDAAFWAAHDPPLK